MTAFLRRKASRKSPIVRSNGLLIIDNVPIGRGIPDCADRARPHRNGAYSAAVETGKDPTFGERPCDPE